MSKPSSSPSSSASPISNWAAQFLGDEYVWKARKAPILLVALPAFFASLPWIAPAHLLALIPASVGCLLLGFCGHIGRILGKQREEALWANWGGKPTTRMLRHCDTPFDKQKLALLHNHLATATGVKAPSARKECEAPDEADKIYDGYATYLRNATRRREEFPLVREELINYGYARNVWGLRPVGLCIAALALLVALARGWWWWKTGATSGWETVVIASIANALFLLFWTFGAREAWVKQIAESYSARLLEGVGVLPISSSTTSSSP